jgi:hypothetical protein
MAEEFTYYAIVDDYSTRQKPVGVLRRTEDDEGQDDQQFGHDLQWTHTPLLYAYERGDGDNQLFEISEDEASEIVERIRRTVTGHE